MTEKDITNKLTSVNFTKGRTQPIKYIVIHYVGATGSAKANCDYYANNQVGASAHYFVDFDGSVWRSVRDDDTAWHCGAKSYIHPECRNANSIGIEMCVRCNGSRANDSREWYFEDSTVESSIELTKYLMNRYGIDADHVIRHYDVTGKICPNPYVYNHTKHTWDMFKMAISSNISDGWENRSGSWIYWKDGEMVKSAWMLINHHWYLFDEFGIMQTGLVMKDGNLYYLCEDGDLEGACMKTSTSGCMTEWYVVD